MKLVDGDDLDGRVARLDGSAVAAIPSSSGISRSITTTSGASSGRRLERPRRRRAASPTTDEVVVELEEVAHAAPDHRVVVHDAGSGSARRAARHRPPYGRHRGHGGAVAASPRARGRAGG